MKRLSLFTALIACVVSLASASAAGVCHRGQVEFAGIKERLVGFAWEGAPQPLAKGIMFETLLDRPSGDNDLSIFVQARSCAAWQEAAEAGRKPIELRFEDTAGLMLVLGDGNALANAVSCSDSRTTINLRVGPDFSMNYRDLGDGT